MAMVMLASFSTCFADPAMSTVRDEEQVSPRFVVTFSHSEGLHLLIQKDMQLWLHT